MHRKFIPVNNIISLMSGYTEFRPIEAFIKSALSTGNDVTVLYDNINTDAMTGLKTKYPNCTFVSYSPYFDKYSIDRSLSPFNLKYIILYLYTKHHLDKKYDHILFSDVSDVYFQSDPFEDREFNGINFFAERLKIGQCITNALWCAQSYGYKQLSQDYNKPIVNTGVLIAKQEALIPFLKNFLNELTKTISQGRLDIADQVAATYYYNNTAPEGEMTLHDLSDGCCVHIAQDIEMRDIHKRLTLKDDILWYTGSKPNIVHQYVRSPDLANFIFTKLEI